GHNFRPEYLRLARLASELQIHPILALTATATPEVARNICSAFSIAPQHHLQTSFHRKKLHLRITPCLPSDRLDLLTKRLANPKISPSIVYVTFQKTAELVATHLSNAGLPAPPYHAGLSPEERHKIQDDFMRGSSPIIVATIAFGMGIDKSNIRSVIHFNLPKTLENYQQEIGRAGRDDLPAFCEILASADDAIPLENFTLGDTPAPEAVLTLVTRLLTSGNSFDISRYDLSQETDIRPLVLETVITYLELSGLLRPTHSFYTTTQIQFLKTETQILAPLNPERQAFLSALFLSGHRTPKYLTLTLETSAEKLHESRERIVKALTWLEETGAITQKPAGLRHAFQLTAEAANAHPATVAAAQSLLFAERESRDSLRLTQILDFTTQTGCITQRLLHYFGEPLPEASCHHCHFCKSQLPSSVIPLPATPIPPFTETDDDLIQALFFEEIPALSTPRQLTRFLCGLTSPATTRAKLTRRPEFARFASHPFRTVLAQVQTCCTEAD
ncbi:MAG: helicase-related protein, partial [Verrucomicrobia bacterium]|nr:helicase-related protein [Verrucomicrobiota bacterium]